MANRNTGSQAAAALALGMIGLAAWRAAERRRQAEALAFAEWRRTRDLLHSFVGRVAEYDQRMRDTLAGPYLVPGPEFAHLAHFARLDPSAVMRLIIGWVHREVAWVSDKQLYGWEEYWQKPAVTYALRKGDCDDKALLALHLFRMAGIEGFRVVVGAWQGQGHAWLESVFGTFADPTTGALLARRPVGYEPALVLGGPAPEVRRLEF